MEVNLKKTQIMIFEKRETKKSEINFHTRKWNDIRSVQESYCYLGITHKHNCSFALAIKQLS
jgi:hypothetical protein